MNPISQEMKDRLRRKISEGVVEIPPPSGKDVSGPCLVPSFRIMGDGDVINKYTQIKDPELGTIGRHVAACIIAHDKLPEPDLVVLHQCDRKCCCEIKHLRLDTRAQDRHEAKVRGLLHSWGSEERFMPRGADNPIAKMTNTEAAEIKWLLQNKRAWFTPEISDHHSLVEALAIAFGKSAPSIKQLQARESWRHVEPIRPASLPSATQISPSATPPAPEKTGPIGAKGAEELLRGYFASTEKSEFVSEKAHQLGVSRKSVYNVLTGVTWKEVAPEIARVKFETHGMQIYSDKTVQAIRATWDLHKNVHGLLKALGRKFGMTGTHVRWIAERIQRKEVPDDPSAALSLDELDLRSAPSGSNHAKCRISDAEILKLYAAHKAGTSKVELAKIFGLSWQTIHKILTGGTRPDLFKKFYEGM